MQEERIFDVQLIKCSKHSLQFQCACVHVCTHTCVSFGSLTTTVWSGQQAVNPPSIGRVVQLIMALWSLSRNRIGFTTSSSSVTTGTCNHNTCIYIQTCCRHKYDIQGTPNPPHIGSLVLYLRRLEPLYKGQVGNGSFVPCRARGCPLLRGRKHYGEP